MTSPSSSAPPPRRLRRGPQPRPPRRPRPRAPPRRRAAEPAAQPQARPGPRTPSPPSSCPSGTTPPCCPPTPPSRPSACPRPLVEVLTASGITAPFPIQVATLPDSLSGRDVLGRGRTGSGKTLAFSIPLVARLAASTTKRQPRRPRALILVPTRELANQVAAVVDPMARALGMKTTTIFGGVGQNPQVSALAGGLDVVIACPGRLEDLIQQGHCDLGAIEVTILDEADHMADLGFLPGVKRIMDRTPKVGQRMLFSATLDNGVDVLVKRYLTNPTTHSVDPAVAPVSTMTHHVFRVDAADKGRIVQELASGLGPDRAVHPHQAPGQEAGQAAHRRRRARRRPARQPQPERPRAQPRGVQHRRDPRAVRDRHRRPRHPRRRRRASSSTSTRRPSTRPTCTARAAPPAPGPRAPSSPSPRPTRPARSAPWPARRGSPPRSRPSSRAPARSPRSPARRLPTSSRPRLAEPQPQGHGGGRRRRGGSGGGSGRRRLVRREVRRSPARPRRLRPRSGGPARTRAELAARAGSSSAASFSSRPRRGR